jgi:DNA-binding CsgD family transcriptional regulator
VIWIGLLTAGTIILFQTVSFFVIYRYIKLDLYLCLVGLCFLVTGYLLNRQPAKIENPQPEDDLLRLLTSRELEVLQLLAEGKTNKEIAASQFIELSTVKTHVNNIYGKIAVRNRMEARVKYLEQSQKRALL